MKWRVWLGFKRENQIWELSQSWIDEQKCLLSDQHTYFKMSCCSSWRIQLLSLITWYLDNINNILWRCCISKFYSIIPDRITKFTPAPRSEPDLQQGYPAVPVTRDVIAQTSRRSLTVPRWVVSPKRLRNFDFENVYDDCIMNYFQISSISIYSSFLTETTRKITILQKRANHVVIVVTVYVARCFWLTDWLTDENNKIIKVIHSLLVWFMLNYCWNESRLKN